MRRFAVASLLTVTVAACHPDMQAWRRQLNDATVSRLGGAWTVELRADSAPYGGTGVPARITGSLSLAMNSQRALASSGPPPLAFGAFDAAFDALHVSTGEDPATPTVWVTRQADSLIVMLAPEAKWPVRLAGAWSGDSIVGRWHAASEPGPSGNGAFVMKRAPPEPSVSQ